MNDPSFLDRAVGQIFEQAETGTALALPPIAQALNASYTLLFRTDRRHGAVDEASCCGVDDGYVRRLKDAARERLLPPWLNGLMPGSVQDRAAFGTDQEFARTPFYNHVIRPEGRFHCLIATPFVSDRLRFHLVVGRPRTRDGFSGGDQRLLRSIVPYVGEILRLQDHLAEAQTFAHDVLDLLDGGNSPSMAVTREGVLLFANQAARRLLSAGQVLHVDRASRMLGSDTLANTGRLRRAIRAAASDDDQRIALPGAEGPTVQLTIRRFGEVDRTCDAQAGSPRLLVRVDGPAHPDARERITGLAREHGLTRRETELLASLSEGATLKSAARQLGMSYNTGRTHLRQIFGKVDLHRQSDLLRLCTTGRRPGR